MHGLALGAGLALESPTGATYSERISKVRTEKGLSDIFEDFTRIVPLGERLFGDLNPVRTGGPMQVSIAFGEEHAEAKRYPYPIHSTIRNEVFTRRGGTYFGIAHLLDHPVEYDDMLCKTELAVRKIAEKVEISEAAIRRDLERGEKEEFADASSPPSGLRGASTTATSDAWCGVVPKREHDEVPCGAMSIRPTDLPPSALLRKYVDEGAYTDCYATDLPKVVTHPQYVEAFYTTAVFKLERLILRWLVAKPSTDGDARRLACGETSAFAAWSVEERTPDQLLMCDYLRRTRSWLMVAPSQGGSGTRLYFGSAVVPVRAKSGQRTPGSSFNALLGFHKLYSRVLLSAARSRLIGTP